MPLFTQSALLKALGWSLFNSLWQMAALWLCHLLLTALLRKSSSHVRHGLAVFCLGTGTILFLVTLFNSYPAAGSGQFFSGDWMPSFHGARQTINALLPYCSFLYLLALTFLFARYINCYMYSRRLKADGLSKIQPRLRLFVKEIAQRMGITREVQVWLSSLVDGPVTLGFLRPVILVPVAMVNNLSVPQVEAILLHELAHIKRYDYLVNLGITVVGILFFFNPFTRLLIRDIRREREHRCDDLVLQFRYDPHAYVSALLSLAAPARYRQTLALAATGKNDRLLLHRVRRILNQQRTGKRPGAKPVIVLLFTLLTAVIGLSGTVNPIARLIQRNKRISEPVTLAFAKSPVETASPMSWNLRTEKPQTAKKETGSRRKKVTEEEYPDEDQVPSQDLLYASNNLDDSSAGQYMTAIGNRDAQPLEVRDYSIQQTNDEPVIVSSSAPMAGAATMPYVPSSSFSYRVTEDSAASLQQLGVLIESGGKASELKLTLAKAIASNQAAIKKSRELIICQEQALTNLRSTSSLCRISGLNLQRQCLEKQVRTQHLKLRQQVELQQKLEIAVMKLRVVHI
ncbi:MAG: M56 family metallopeptidase [Bacteroidota bacterium]|nr:M56 family metallopeptidase [Bacteroidota bacterium]